MKTDLHRAKLIDQINIRNELKPGDMGYIIHRHGMLYAEEQGFGAVFEKYVADGFVEFYDQYDVTRDCVWVCEHQERIVGFLLLMHRTADQAQLRFFYLEPAYRGIGLGNKLMSLFMNFLESHHYRSAYLWTTHEQDAAAALYKKLGFVLTAEKSSTNFGKPLVEQRYDWISRNNTKA